MPNGVDQPIVVATCATYEEATAGREVLERHEIEAQLRRSGDRTEIVVGAPHAPRARRALLDDRLEGEGRTSSEMSLVMKLALVVAFLAVVAFAVLTVLSSVPA